MDVSPSHFAERFALIVIIALGESIVAIGIGTSELERDTTYALSVVVAFAGVAALWWAYFDFTAVAARACAPPSLAGRARAARARRLHVLPLPGRARDHPLRRRGEEDARASARSALGAPVAGLSGSASRSSSAGSRSCASASFAGSPGSGSRPRESRSSSRSLLDGTDAIVTLAVVIAVLVLSVAVETARLRELRAEIRSG